MKQLSRLRPVYGLEPRVSSWHAQARTFASAYTPSQVEPRRGPSRRKRTKPVKLYSIPRLVLDLDAEGCPGVRPYTEQDEKAQRELWGRDPNVDALVRRMSDLREELQETGRLWRSKLGTFDARRITSRDIFSVAFLGSPSNQTERLEKSQSGDLAEPGSAAPKSGHHAGGLGSLNGEVLGSIGVPSRITEDEHQTVQILLHRLRHQGPQNTKPEQLGKLQEKLARSDLSHVRRILAPLLESDEGCKLVSLSGPAILSACARDSNLAADDEAYASQARTFLRNVSANLRSRGLVPSNPLDLFHPLGQRLLGSTRLASDARHLLALGGFFDGSAGLRSLVNLIDLMSQNDIRRSEVFSLLTEKGRFSGVPGSSLRDMLCEGDQTRGDTYANYIFLLGNVGALRTLLHEWHLAPSSSSFSDGPDQPPHKRDYFVPSVIRSLSLLPASEVFESATGDYSEDVRLDLESIRRLEESGREAHSDGIAWEATALALSQDVERVLQTADVGQAMLALQELTRRPVAGR